jgi:PilZ domain/SPOR domain
MIAPSMNPERREHTRTTVNRLAYINLESNNGAIVLNVSNGGLSFHSVDPVRRSETIRFWFLDHNHRIEADGRLAWMDETRKTGGLQFTTLPAEARAQIHDWISQPAAPRTVGGKPARPHSSPSELPALSASHLNRNAGRDNSVPREVRSANLKTRALWSGFSGGLVFGILISALVAGAFLLHAYRREFGQSLIRWGERLGARYEAPAAPPTLSTISPPEAELTPVEEKAPTQPFTKLVRPQQMKIELLPPSSITRAPIIATSSFVPAPAVPSQPPPPSLPTASVETNASKLSDKAGSVAEPGGTSHPGIHIEGSKEVDAGSSSTKFLEVGKFHDAIWANKTTDKLTQLGFRPTVIHRGRLWMNSYQVLVGPYDSEADAELAHANLVSRGFRPRSYERGSRSLTFFSGLTLNGARLPVGDLVITWESYIPDAIVKFEKGGSVVGTTDGKWEKRSVKYGDDAIVYRKNSDGSRTLLEIRFAGMSQALVFGKSS